MFLPLFCAGDLETSNELMPTAGELMLLNSCLSFLACNAEHWGQFVLARTEVQRVYGGEWESHNEHTRITLKHSTCPHKWLGDTERLDL